MSRFRPAPLHFPPVRSGPPRPGPARSDSPCPTSPRRTRFRSHHRAHAALPRPDPVRRHLFLLLASLANVGKNVSWLASSATRAQMHLSLTKHANIGDLTAKITSQSIAASLVGTAVGIGASYITGAEAASIMMAFLPLSAISCVIATPDKWSRIWGFEGEGGRWRWRLEGEVEVEVGVEEEGEEGRKRGKEGDERGRGTMVSPKFSYLSWEISDSPLTRLSLASHSPLTRKRMRSCGHANVSFLPFFSWNPSCLPNLLRYYVYRSNQTPLTIG